MASHRSRICTRADFIKAYSLPFFRNPNVKSVVMKCETCHPKVPLKKVYNRAEYKRFSLED